MTEALTRGVKHLAEALVEHLQDHGDLVAGPICLERHVDPRLFAGRELHRAAAALRSMTDRICTSARISSVSLARSRAR